MYEYQQDNKWYSVKIPLFFTPRVKGVFLNRLAASQISHKWSFQVGHDLYVDILHPAGVQAVQFNSSKHAVRGK